MPDENEKRRTSSSSLSDASDSKRHRLTTEKGSLERPKERSEKKLGKDGAAGKDNGLTSLINKCTTAEDTSTMKKIDQGKHSSLEKSRANTPNPDRAHHCSLSRDKESRDKTSRESSVVSEKSRKHHTSRKSSFDSERAVEKTSVSSEKCSKLSSSGSAQHTRTENKIHCNDKKSATKKSSTEGIKKKGNETDSKQELNQKSLTKHNKDILKKKGMIDEILQSDPKQLKTAIGQPVLDSSTTTKHNKADEKTRNAKKRKGQPIVVDNTKHSKKTSSPVVEKPFEENISKTAGKPKKLSSKPLYKMTREEWMLMGKPSVDTFKVTQKPSVPLTSPLHASSLPLPEPDVTRLATDSVAVESEKPVEQFDACYEKSVPPPECGMFISTDFTSSYEEALTPFNNNNEADEKGSIIRFQGNMQTISEAHVPVITIRDEDNVPLPVSTSNVLSSTMSDESSGINPNAIVNFKLENELIIDDSNFPSGLSLKEEPNVDSNSEVVYLPVDVVVSKPLVAFPLANAGQWPSEPFRDFPGRIELTKLVEYFILLNQDLIKYNDSYRIASRLDETLRRVDERRANSDLLLVIKKVKPIIEELVNSVKLIGTTDEDLQELLYVYKEVLPSDALKLKADTLSRKAIADIFHLISEGDMDEIGFYQSSTVIVYNKEQGLNKINLPPIVKTEPMNQRYQSVIRNVSHKPIEQNEFKQCAICLQKATIPCGLCDAINVCSKNHMREHRTNFHNMSKSIS